MRITDIQTIPLEVELHETVYDANYTMKNKPALLVQIFTDDGLIGIGEAAHFGGPMSSTVHVIEQELKPYLIGKDPINTELLWDLMHKRAYKHARGGIIIAAISGIDIALWDLKGKITKLPCWRLMGGYRKRVPAYATGGFYSESKNLDDLAVEMKNYVDAGFRAVKMKVGRNSGIELSPLRASEECGIAEVTLDEDIRRVDLVRRTIGPDIKLCVDANGAWDVATAVKMGRRMEPFDIYWYEEPVWPDDLLGSKEVAQKVSIPVAGYETCSYGLVDFQRYISHRAVHFVQPDVAWSGGLTECLKIAHLAQAANLPVAPHIHGSAIAVAAGLHLLGAIRNGSMAETVFPAHPLMTQLVKEPLNIEKDTGDIILSETPGLGIDLNLDVVDRYRTSGK
ncbi:MAG: mandelate racemase/muconate lactonizing enzyme family protein [Proteobacteria bacterium]|nr:mandelate racemase/muconate lactonizing enzyme family protein [Pseudomonadota bacterium]MDA1331050.1 mandelate racemase/muconate lactonizing enzyme family protein [Pseudomonadota bacterium]